MQILLINANPVVSRLLFLCTRDSDLILTEVTCVEDVQGIAYDLIFIDDGSYVDGVSAFLEKETRGKKVFITYLNDVTEGFDETIQKPFLPSQIIQLIESVEQDEIQVEIDETEKQFIFPLSSEKELETPEEEVTLEIAEAEDEYLEKLLELDDETIQTEEGIVAVETPEPNVLDGSEIEKIKALLEMDEIEDSVDELSEDEVEIRKIEVIKEQLISEGLEILDEDEIIDELSGKQKEKKALKKSKKKERKKKQNILGCTKEELLVLESALSKKLLTLSPKKIKKFFKGKKIKLKIKSKDKHS